jgi:predicted dienelactone hydrolase
VRHRGAWGALLVCVALLLGAAAAYAREPRFAVGEINITFRDTSRMRTLATVIRYPAVGNPARTDVREATPARSAGPFPLVVFAHGFAVTPTTYKELLQAWARAGYVVAAPVFPLTNARAPGGPNESDLVNQPRDMSFVITSILARRWGILKGIVNPKEIAVSGQSDGGSTALAAAYNSNFIDRRIDATMILSGAEIPGVSGYDFPPPSPPLLAVQGTADTSNAPASTYRYFGIAPHPKFLLSLLGAGHLPPYTSQQPQLGVVERETVAFLDRYLKRLSGAAGRMWSVGNVPGVATLSR